MNDDFIFVILFMLFVIVDVLGVKSRTRSRRWEWAGPRRMFSRVEFKRVNPRDEEEAA